MCKDECNTCIGEYMCRSVCVSGRMNGSICEELYRQGRERMEVTVRED